MVTVVEVVEERDGEEGGRCWHSEVGGEGYRVQLVLLLLPSSAMGRRAHVL